MNADHFTPFAPNGLGTGQRDVGAASPPRGLTLWAFIGLESATVPAEEVKDPEKTIPRATYSARSSRRWSTSSRRSRSWGSSRWVGWPDSIEPVRGRSQRDVRRSMGQGRAPVALISVFGGLNGWILIQGRIPLAAARDGLFPKRFARVHGRRGTPVFGLVVSSLLISALMLMNYSKVWSTSSRSSSCLPRSRRSCRTRSLQRPRSTCSSPSVNASLPAS